MPRESEPLIVVDDSENDAQLLREALEQAEVENPLIHLSNFDETVDYFLGRGKYLDRAAFPLPLVVFLDIHMPGKSGFDVLKWLRRNEKTRGQVVIMMSGSSHPPDIARSYAEGANSYLLKPKSTDELVKILKHFRTYWIGLNHYAY